MKFGVLLAALLLVPGVVFGAGFAKQSLFLSKTGVTEGDTVLIHATVSNDARAKFTGELVFSDAGKKIGSAPVSLAAGEAQIASISWKPAAGEHAITAELHQGDQVLEKESATFTIAEKPKLKTEEQAQEASAIESSQKIQEGVAGLSPAAAQATGPVFRYIDSGRQAIANALDGQIASTKKNIGPDAGAVLGAEATKNAPQNPMGAFWFMLQTLYLYLLTLLRFLVGNAGVFYPVLAVAFLYGVWRIIKRFRRPAY